MNRVFCLSILIAACGCAGPGAVPTTQATNPTTNPTVLATTQPSYWLQQPAAAQVRDEDFQRLCRACEDAARHFGFKLDLVDYRQGLIMTLPLTSAQFFEPWRRDVQTIRDAANASLASFQRTVRFQIGREGGRFVATPYVLVERQVRAEQPVTSAAFVRSAVGRYDKDVQGTRETDRGIYLPRQYAYVVGRDEVLEKKIAADVTARVQGR